MYRLASVILIVALLVVAGCGPKPGPAAAPVPAAVPAAVPVEQPKPPAAAPGELTLAPVKDSRLLCHPSEEDQNGGTSTRLRVCDLRKSSAEMILMDFDRAALKAFLDGNKGKAVTARLVLTVREVQNGPGKVELASLDSASDWNEGKGAQEQAQNGEVCYLAAQMGAKKWAAADGKEVANCRDLLYDRRGNEIRTVLNGKSVEVAKSQENQTVQLELDARFLEHLATAANCRGIVLFTRDETPKVDFFSREQSSRSPKLELTAK